MDLDSSKTDEYFVTALHIFDYCGVDSAGTLRVDSMMDTFAPFVKTKKAEYKCLKSFLDPHKSNPAINVTELATALSRYSEEQKTKIDLDESFNLRSGLVPQDSDSGISTDGYQILEELQTELREKSHLAQQLRGQLEFTDRQHEEALAALTAERDSLRAHVNILREENLSLSHLRKDYDEACERLCASETALDDTKREYEALRRRARVLHEQVSTLENDKLTLQEQLSRSKEECHRINDLYSSRQAALLEQHESLEAACAELSARARQHDRAMALVVSEKVLLETELKDLLNRSTVSAPPPPRSVDVSYTEEQMLTALDSLNADSRFSPENHLLDEESFVNALKEDQGRATNVSLFDEIRMSFGNISRLDLDPKEPYCYRCNEEIDRQNCHTQTDPPDDGNIDNNNSGIPCSNSVCQTACLDCEKNKEYASQLKSDLKKSQMNASELKSDLNKYEDNLQVLQKYVDDGNVTNRLLQATADQLNAKLVALEAACKEQKARPSGLDCVKSHAQSQTYNKVFSVSTQADVPCVACEKRTDSAPANAWRRYIWEPIKSLFTLFASLCLLSALMILYNVSNYHYAARRCIREAPAVPWRWLNVHDLFDYVFRIEYVGEVPM
ncbi:hypothetical protein JYU34_005645 [Plutella xylostella]|uniref:Uncharacterized protein n=1 Tax=Plutella xylostella TaxID=51655 RepID=A0ABQ7QTR5_PLUXY|nr:hypothetical protein JYU34_005645 [Plutella xylostella]